MNFRAKDSAGNILEQEYNGKCFQWLHEGQDITIDRGTRQFDRHENEIFEGDTVLVNYKEGESSKVTVRFSLFTENHADGKINCHQGFFLQDPEGETSDMGALNKYSEVVG